MNKPARTCVLIISRNQAMLNGKKKKNILKTENGEDCILASSGYPEKL
jgi:hypothetical protein